MKSGSSGSPEAIHSWFYPGDNTGWEFVYPKEQNLEAKQEHDATHRLPYRPRLAAAAVTPAVPADARRRSRIARAEPP